MCKNQAVLLWAISLKQKPAEATSTLSYGCRRSGRNPLHLWRGGSQCELDGKRVKLAGKAVLNSRGELCIEVYRASMQTGVCRLYTV
ncbi:hypothetical protein [uncultured Parasutterella sp.]|uniref:hypothetical protein n=1 Tax=uncultured Parasutterella sp. TaxID=1263098 RepID=UPI0025D16384|nr:hypothetical protein [uncultured Parasutterella sp.]